MHIYTHKYTCMYMCVCVCEGEERERRGGGEGSGVGWSVCGWVGEYVLLRVLCVLCCVLCCVVACLSGCVLCVVSLKINGAQQLRQVKRMIGGLENVLFSTCSQTLNG